MLTSQVAHVGHHVLDILDGFGRFARFTAATARWSIRSAGGFARFGLLVPQLYHIGTLSIPVVMLVGAFVGAVIGVEAFDQFAAIGQETRLGGVINISVVKQIGPVLAAVMIAGRVGGSISAELGTMRVTEQLDALRVMGAEPIAYLVVPRVVACILMVPILTVFSDLLGMFGGWLVVVQGYGVNAREYMAFSEQFITTWDIMTGLIKSVVFGVTIGMIACYKGFHCASGAAGVGRASTDSFVTSFIAIIVINLVLAKFLNNMYQVLFGAPSPTAFG